MVNEIELEVAPGARVGEYAVRVIRAASGGEPRAVLRLDLPRLLRMRPTLESAVLASAAHARGGPVPEIEQPLRDAGQELFEGLFTGAVRETYRASVAVARERGSKLRVVLHLDAAELAALPWEAMWDSEARSYLCRKEPLVRHVASPFTPDPLPVTPPLRVLCLVASPRGLPPLDVERERQHLDEALASATADGRLHLAWLENATWDALQDRLLSGTWHVLHFIGHGDYDPVLDQGRVALTREEDGRADWVEAGRLVDLLNEADPTPRLVVLNSCSSGQSGTQDILSGTAAALVNGGISAVAAMQFRISDPAAVAFPRGFYKALAAGKPVDAALSSGRIAILGRGESLEWVTPVLYMRGGASQLFTLGLPTGAEGEAVVPAAPRGAPASGTPAPVAPAPLPGGITDDPRYQLAQDASQRGDWDEAIILLEQISTEHPETDIPELARARRKRDLAAWWTQSEPVGTDAAPSTTPGPEGPASAAGDGPRAPEDTTGSRAGWAPAGEDAQRGGGLPPPPPSPPAPAEQPPGPEPASTGGHRKRSTIIAGAVLLAVLGGGAWLLTGGADRDGATDASAPVPTASATTRVPSPTPSERTSPPGSAQPNLAAFTLDSEAAELQLGEERAFEVRAWNKPSTSRTVGPAAGGALTVAIGGPQLVITGGAPLGPPASGCELSGTASDSITCAFGRLEPDGTARFRITLRAVEEGDVRVTTSATPSEGTRNPGIVRTFTVVPGVTDCVVPDVVGFTRAQAEEAIRSAELEPAPNGVEAGEPFDRVLRQAPPEGTRVDCGSGVSFWYSTLL